MRSAPVFFMMVLLLFASCQKEMEVGQVVIPKQKLFTACFIGDLDSVTTVYLTRSQPVLGTPGGEKVFVNDAAVTIFNNAQTVMPVWNDQVQAYTTFANELSLVAGNSYTLRVTSGDESIEGTTTLPVAAAVSFVTSIDSLVEKEDSTRIFRITASCTLNENVHHTMRLAALMIFEDSSRVELTADESSLLFDIAAHATQTVHFSQFINQDMPRPVRLELIALTVDDAYYRYHLDIEKTNQLLFLPFTEPFFVYSNMSGKLGIVCSYVTSRHEVIPL